METFWYWLTQIHLENVRQNLREIQDDRKMTVTEKFQQCKSGNEAKYIYIYVVTYLQEEVHRLPL